VLLGFNKFAKAGLIHNFVSVARGPALKTVDALMVRHAVLQYLNTQKTSNCHCTYGKTQNNMQSHLKGTLFGIRMDGDGLLMHGAGLTWMDAELSEKRDSQKGKAVEILALCISRADNAALGGKVR
jgi:glycogen debranching enzyme